MTIKFTQDADVDIESIIDYTIATFGVSQAEKYYKGLGEKLDAILAKTVHSTNYSFVKQGLERTNYKSHAIYYQRSEDGDILVMRVLHQQMDELRHLES